MIFCSISAWILVKQAAFCGNNFENVRIIMRIIGGFKRIPERIIGRFNTI